MRIGADHVGQRELAAGFQHPQRLAQEILARVEVKGALHAHHLVEGAVRHRHPGRRTLAQVDAVGQAALGDALARQPDLGAGDVEPRDMRRLKPVYPENVLVAEAEPDIYDFAAWADSGRFGDQHGHGLAGIVDRTGGLPVTEVEIKALAAESVGRDQLVDVARRHRLERCVEPEKVVEGLAPFAARRRLDIGRHRLASSTARQTRGRWLCSSRQARIRSGLATASPASRSTRSRASPRNASDM